MQAKQSRAEQSKQGAKRSGSIGESEQRPGAKRTRAQTLEMRHEPHDEARRSGGQLSGRLKRSVAS